jgi:hypothetical protein
MIPTEKDTTIYKAVVNHEEQYSIWPEYNLAGRVNTLEALTPAREMC